MSEKLPPIHPGEILREEFMLPLGLSSHALARAIGVTPTRIDASRGMILRLARLRRVGLAASVSLLSFNVRHFQRAAARFGLCVSQPGPFLQEFLRGTRS